MITFIFVKINLCCIGIVLLLFMTQFSSVQSLSCVQFFATPWIMARQASLSITNSRSSFKLKSIELVMPSSHLILCRPLLLLLPIPPSIRIFSNESTLPMRWPKYWSSSFSISPSNGHEFGWTPGVGDGQGGLVCCGSCGRKAWLSSWPELNWKVTLPAWVSSVK